MSRAFGLICGHCSSNLRIRTSEGAHICLRTLFLQCTNELCGATYRGFAEVTHQYSPSAVQSPAFSLPTPPRALQIADRRAIQALENKNQLNLLDASDEDAEESDLQDTQGSAI